MKKENLKIIVQSVDAVRHWSPDGYSEPTYTITGIDEEGNNEKWTSYENMEDFIKTMNSNNITVIDADTNEELQLEFFN